jgi:hypothetical protein
MTLSPEDDITGDMELRMVITRGHRIKNHQQKSGHEASDVAKAYEQKSML